MQRLDVAVIVVMFPPVKCGKELQASRLETKISEKCHIGFRVRKTLSAKMKEKRHVMHVL